jgi:serine/threonine protein kinase
MGTSDYDPLRLIGKGSYGKVFLVKRKGDSKICVLKKVPLAGLGPEEKNESYNEVFIKLLYFFL